MTPPVSSEVFRLDAVDLVQRLRTRELSCVELMEATLNRIDALNPTFNAIVARRSGEDCLAEARAKDSGPCQRRPVRPAACGQGSRGGEGHPHDDGLAAA
jgi:Asp-tRNA(Asn)/Glu-tRNA(Gln) amidotransferase A subunit family amidase